MQSNTIYALLLITVYCLLFTATSHAQQRRLMQAERHVEAFEYRSAVPLYLQLVERYNLTAAKIGLAECYSQLNELNEAEYWWFQVVATPKALPEYKLRLAMILQQNGKCEQARIWVATYREEMPNDSRGTTLWQACDPKVQQQLLETNVANDQISHPVPLNSIQDDFGAIPFQKGLLFTSARHHRGFQVHVDTRTGQPFLDLYYVDFWSNDSLAAIEPKYYSAGLNTPLHDGPICFTADQQTAYFSRNVPSKKSAPHRLHLFSAQWEDGTWRHIEALPINNLKYSIIHPTLSADGQRLYFASDMPGGVGGMDLYVSILHDGQWSSPINLNTYYPNLNTAGNEVFPFMQGNGVLYFASDSHVGLGGLDIFYVTLTDSKNTTITNLGYPINSTSDDFSFILTADGQFGYFSSNRQGGLGGDDIYQLKIRN